MERTVASFTDAWIETPADDDAGNITKVASFTDAWIETKDLFNALKVERSHLLQMRGLKQWVDLSKNTNRESHLLQMRGLKQKKTILLFMIKCRIFYRCVD